MEYYAKQVYLHHFSSYKRQLSRGIGAISAGIRRVALLFVKIFFTRRRKHWEGIAYTKCH